MKKSVRRKTFVDMISHICGIQNKEAKLIDTNNRLLVATDRVERARWMKESKDANLQLQNKRYGDKTSDRMVVIVNNTVLHI